MRVGPNDGSPARHSASVHPSAIYAGWRGGGGTNKMVELSNGHIGPDVLSHRNECDPNHCQSLMKVVLLLRVQMIMTMIKHTLNFEHVPSSRVRANVDQDKGLFSQWRLDHFKRFDRRIRCVLSTYTTINSSRSGGRREAHTEIK